MSLNPKQMTATLDNFLASLKTIGVAPLYNFVASEYINNVQSSPSMTIPAKNDLVGKLSIYDDGEEVTIEIGELHHTHFSAHNYDGDTSEKRLLAATDDAAQYVADILADLIYISVDYSHDRCIGSSTGYLNSDSQRTDMVRNPDAPLFHNDAMAQD